ncbi:MAG: DUF2306 domain-containing protein [Granulosicoccus sp.]|nr:DUF2306 domain-containing protein [Granulosicoccus sp.]
MNWQVFTELSTLQVQIHWMAAVISLVLGLSIFLRPKGNRLHRLTGRAYVFTLMVTAISAFFIRGPAGTVNSPAVNGAASLLSGFSWIHLLIPYTLISLFMAIRAIRQGRVKDHKSGMIYTYIGALIVAGAFTFLPGRHMHTLFFGDPVMIQESIEKGFRH